MTTGANLRVTTGFVVGATICSALGNALQPISLLAWLQPLISLVAYDRLVLLSSASGLGNLALGQAAAAAILTFTNGLGMTIGWAGIFAFPVMTYSSLLAAFASSLAISAVTTLITLVLNHVANSKWPGSLAAALAFPCLSTANFTLISAVGSSAFAPAIAIMDYEPLRQMCALWGLPGATFLMASTVAVAYMHLKAAFPELLGATCSIPDRTAIEQLPSELGLDDAVGSPLLSQSAQQQQRQPCQHQRTASPMLHAVTYGLLAMWSLAALSGGFLIESGLFYEVDIETLLPRTIQASCLIEATAAAGSPELARLWAKTEDRLQAGDDIILWSEDAAHVDVGEEEEQLWQHARELLSKHGNRSYIGMAYTAFHPDVQLYTNHFTLMKPDGELAWTYRKAFPVPVLEANVIPGPPQLPVHDAPFGRLSGAICFDLDHVRYLLQAAQQQVDILMQPSWTWGSLGPRHFMGNQLRAIEGGYTIIRCSTGGVSGVVTPGGQVTAQAYTGTSDMVLYTVPLFPRRWTPYAHLGLHYLEWVNLAGAVLLCGAMLFSK